MFSNTFTDISIDSRSMLALSKILRRAVLLCEKKILILLFLSYTFLTEEINAKISVGFFFLIKICFGK